MADKMIKPSDLKDQARELLRSGKMPSLEAFSKVMTEARADYAPKVKKIREAGSSS